MSNLWRDVRIGARVLLRSPGFVAVSVLTLALGVAANTAIFSVVYATFIAPLPYREPDRLVMVWLQYRGQRVPARPADLVEWRRQAEVFDDLNAFSWRSVNLATRDRPEHLEAGPVTPGYLAMLGYGHPLALGRDFLEEEATPGRDRVAILTHRLWSERFGADRSIVGQTIRVDGQPHVVVGVLGKGPADLNQNQLWVPLAFTPEQLDDRTSPNMLNVLGRLKRGVTVEQANARMAAVCRRSAEAHPGLDRDLTISVEPFRNDFLSEGTKRGLWLLLAAVGFVLLIACANVANLLLARGTARARELAVRTALGASRGQLVRQLMTESVLLAAVGGAIGVGLAAALLRLVIALMPPFLLPTEADVRLDVPVLLFSVAACGLSGVLAGSAPAWQAMRASVSESLKLAAPSVGGGGGRLRQALVVLEVALALTLLTAGGLALQGLSALARVDLGFRADRVLTFMLPVPEDPPTPPEKARQLYEELLERARRLPGVSSAAVSTSMPLQRGGMGVPFTIAGRPPADPSRPTFALLNKVSPGYFATLGIRTTRGRAFTERDAAGGLRVAMVNETLVKRYLPDVDPLGQRLAISEPTPGASRPGPPAEWQIVGVFADVRHGGAADEAFEEIAVPFDQSPWPSARVAVRTSGEAAGVRRGIEAIVRSLDPDLPVADVKTMAQRVSESVAGDRFNTVLFGGFAAVALLLAAFGIYGVMSFAVAQRTREIGLRMALGAERAGILRGVLREGLTTALAGIVLGSAGAWFAVRMLRGIVHGVGGFSPGPFLAVASTLLLAALLACAVPAMRAASVQPVVALRED